MTLKICFTALAMSVASTAVLAQPDPNLPNQPGADSSDETIVIVPVEPMPGSDLFGRLDADGDGSISKDEAQKNDISQNFDEFDTDQSGEISAREYHIFAMTPAGEPPESLGAPGGGELLDEEGITLQFKELDSDNDGLLNRSEADAESELLFSEADADGDRSIDLEEYKDVHRVGAGPGGGDIQEGIPAPRKEMSY